MRLAVLADIHSNLPALEAVLDALDRHSPDGIIVAGDHLTGGARPVETIRPLRSLGAWLIRGNTDDRLLAYHAGKAPTSWYTSRQWAGLRWLHHQLDTRGLDFIAAQPGQCLVSIDSTTPIRVVHGSLQSPSEHLYPEGDDTALDLFRKAGLLRQGHKPRALGTVFAQIDEHTLFPTFQQLLLRTATKIAVLSQKMSGIVRSQPLTGQPMSADIELPTRHMKRAGAYDSVGKPCKRRTAKNAGS